MRVTSVIGKLIIQHIQIKFVTTNNFNPRINNYMIVRVYSTLSHNPLGDVKRGGNRNKTVLKLNKHA